MDQIIITDLLVRGIIGVNPEERLNRQDIVINLVLDTDIRLAAATDDITQTVSYSAIARRIVEHVEHSSDLLIEKLVTDIARIILTEFPISRARVRLEKPRAVRYARNVGIEIVRTPEDFA